MDGFIYTAVGTGNSASVQQRLAWIGSPSKDRICGQDGNENATTGTGPRLVFASQPYEQLTQVYRRAGRDIEARTVAVARRRDLRRLGNLKWHRKAFNRMLDVTIQYGYQTWRALAGLVVLYMIVLTLSLIAQHVSGSIVPARSDVGMRPPPSALRCAGDYQCFYPAGY